jgi:predicted 3-demethylubiquinone-9 3-methyltransferase (glyoxalase superfamily)
MKIPTALLALTVPLALALPTAPPPAAEERLAAPEVVPLLMFEGRAREAMDLYVSLFPGSEVESLELYGPGEPGEEGSVKVATFSLSGRRVRCIDSYVDHPFAFTPALSLFVECATAEEVDRLFAELSKEGRVFMPLGQYPFSPRFAWIADRFGVSWQLFQSQEGGGSAPLSPAGTAEGG